MLSSEPGNTDSAVLSLELLDNTPIQQAPYRVPDRLKPGVKKELEGLLEADIVAPSTSPWVSPIVPVTKSDGSVLVCVDYRKLNEVTVKDPYYMPTLDDILERVGSCHVLSKLDLAKGYYQVKVAAGSREKTAFISPFGKYEFSWMPFGLKNAPAVFQRLMDGVLNECYSYAAPYIDDILIFSPNWAEHLVHVRSVLAVLRKHGLTAKPSKCTWGRSYVEYLGHIVGSGIVAVPRMRVTAMAEFQQPVTKKNMRAVLGSVGYYRKFIPHFSRYSSVLTPATCHDAPGKVVWSPKMLEAFSHLRSVLCSVCVLNIPGSEDIFILQTDASAGGVGAVLNVVRDDKILPVAFFSKQLQGAERRY